jgi:hypothetical protein
LAAEVRRTGQARFRDWLSGQDRPREPADLIGRFTFDGELKEIPNVVAGAKGAGQGVGLTSVEGVAGQAVRFDGDQGATFPGLLQNDRWDPFTLDLWIRDNVASSKPVVLAQRCYGTDVGFNGFDLMLEGGALTFRMYRVWPGNGIGVRALELVAAGQWQHVTATYDGSSRAAGLRLYLNGDELNTEILRDRIHKSAATAAFGDGNFTLGQRLRDRGFKGGDVDELRVYGRALTAVEARQLHVGAANGSEAYASATQAELEDVYFSAIDDSARQAAGALREARHRLVSVEDEMYEVAVMEELPTLRPTYILARGAYDAPKTDANRVRRDVFRDMLPPFPNGAPRDRLGLARWMTDPNHPLTARVAVNRVWMNFFGRGLAATPENFGRQGEAPTHPELLDWLARDFIEHGWNLKRLCRQIVLSATYRQDSQASAQLRQQDPDNQLLARGPSRRLSAEQVRDLALAASGLLDRTIGGPPTFPYQPGEDLWRETNSMSPAYRQSTGTALYRRSLYSVWKRTAPLPNMLVFDAPTREVCTISRGRTNTPLQALVLLNDVQYVEAARALAVQVARTAQAPSEQIGEAFLRLAGRKPRTEELELLTDLYGEQLQLFTDAQQDPAKLSAIGEAKLETALDPAALSALTVTCQAILNLDATVYER